MEKLGQFIKDLFDIEPPSSLQELDFKSILYKLSLIEGKTTEKEMQDYVQKLKDNFLSLYAYALAENSQIDEAIDAVSQISPEFSNFETVYREIGLAYYDKDNHKSSLKWLNKSYKLKQDPIVKKVIDSAQWELAIEQDYQVFRNWQKLRAQHYESLVGKKKQANQFSLNKKYPDRYSLLERAIEMNRKLCLVDLTNLESGLAIFKEESAYFPQDQDDISEHIKLLSELIEVGGYRLIPHAIKKKVKEFILELSNRFDRLKIFELAEKCNEPTDVIVLIIKKMLDDDEIRGEYFHSSGSVIFDKDSNKKIG